MEGLRVDGIEELHFENADKITKEVFETWAAPKIRKITFVGSGIWPEILQSIQSKCPGVRTIRLTSMNTQLVKCDPFAQLLEIVVSQSKVHSETIDALASAQSEILFLSECEIDAETLDYVSDWRYNHEFSRTSIRIVD